MSKSTSTKQIDKINGRPLLNMGPHTILIDANATPFELSEEIDRRITQAKGVTHLLCGINLSDAAGTMADNCISSTAWGLTETLEEIETLSNQLWRCKVQSAPNQVKPPPEKKSVKEEAATPADSLDDNLQMHFGPEVTAGEIADFIDKRLSQLKASLLMMQSDLYC